MLIPKKQAKKAVIMLISPLATRARLEASATSSSKKVPAKIVKKTAILESYFSLGLVFANNFSYSGYPASFNFSFGMNLSEAEFIQ